MATRNSSPPQRATMSSLRKPTRSSMPRALQDLVADRVTVLVVAHLEVVHVDDAGFARAAPRGRPRHSVRASAFGAGPRGGHARRTARGYGGGAMGPAELIARSSFTVPVPRSAAPVLAPAVCGVRPPHR